MKYDKTSIFIQGLCGLLDLVKIKAKDLFCALGVFTKVWLIAIHFGLTGVSFCLAQIALPTNTVSDFAIVADTWTGSITKINSTYTEGDVNGIGKPSSTISVNPLVDFGVPLIDVDISPDNRTIFALNEDGVVTSRDVLGRVDPLNIDLPISDPKYLRVSADGRRLFVASESKVISLNLYEEGVFEKGKSTIKGKYQHVQTLTSREKIVAMDVHPDGDSLYVVVETPTPPITIRNDLFAAVNRSERRLSKDALFSRVGGSLADNQGQGGGTLYSGTISIEKIGISNDTHTQGLLRSVPPSGGQIFSDTVAYKITDMAISPDGNFALITAKGVQIGRSTPFGILPTSDELTGGVIVVNLNTLKEIDFIPTSLQGEKTSQVRRAIALTGRIIKHPVVQFWDNQVLSSGARADVASGSLAFFSLFYAEHFNNIYVRDLYERAYRDYGIMQAYFDMYPTDMVGASGVGISNRGDLAIVSMANTNNIGFIPFDLSDLIGGYGGGDTTNFFFSTATRKAINGLRLELLPGSVTEGNPRTQWLAPGEVRFAGNDTLAVVGMHGGTARETVENKFGVVDLVQHRFRIFGAEDGFREQGLSSGVLKLLERPGAHTKPLQVATSKPVDSDGDGLSNHVEAFNRWNTFKEILFGDASRLVSTSDFNVSNPSTIPQSRVFPADLASQGYLLPHSGLGYRFNYNGHLPYSVNAGSNITVSTIEKVGRIWHDKFLDKAIARPYFIVMSMSHPGESIVEGPTGEILHFKARDGFQANFAYLKHDTDASHDFVLSNGPATPQNNNIVSKDGFDFESTKELVNLLLNEPTVERIIMDPLAAEMMGLSDPKIEIHGVLNPEDSTATIPIARRDHDNFFRVQFRRPSGITITGDGTALLANGATTDRFIVDDEPSLGDAHAIHITIQNTEARYLKLTGDELFYASSLANESKVLGDEDGFIDISTFADVIVWAEKINPAFSVELYDETKTAIAGATETYKTTQLSIGIEIDNPSGFTSGDRDDDQIPDYADGFNLDRSRSGDSYHNFIPDELDNRVSDLGFGKATIKVNTETPLSGNPVIKIDYDASFPGNVDHRVERLRRGIFRVTHFGLPEQGSMRLWKKDSAVERELEDFVGPGQYTFEELGMTGQTLTLYIEALADLGKSPIQVSIDPDGLAGPLGFIATDTALVNAGSGVDLNVGVHEDFEDVDNDPSQPGKIVLVRNTASNGNGIPDYLSFTGDSSHKFAPVELNIPDGLGPGAEISIDYSASDPNDIQAITDGLVIAGAGSLRLWKKDGDQARDPAEDYIAPGTYKIGEIPNRFYVEAVRPSSSVADLRITVQLKTGVSEGTDVSGVPVRGTVVAFIHYSNDRPSSLQEDAVRLTAYEQLWEDNFASDAAYRKFDINGQPIAEPEPNQFPERDAHKHGVYVDAYTLNPFISQTDISVPLLGEGMNMEFRRTSSVDNYLGADGNPVSPVGHDTILGPGWRSCIGMRVVAANGRYNLYDDNGQLHRYNRLGQPIPHSFLETSTHRTQLKINKNQNIANLIDSVQWTRNFWTTYFFEAYTPDQEDFGKRPIVGQLLRLKLILDRNGNGVELIYDSQTDSYPSSMHEIDFDEKAISFTYQDTSDGLRLDTVTDPNGNVFTYNFGGSSQQLVSVEYPSPGPQAVGTSNVERYTYVNKTADGLPDSDTMVHFTGIETVTNRNGKVVEFEYDSSTTQLSDSGANFYDDGVKAMRLSRITTAAHVTNNGNPNDNDQISTALFRVDDRSIDATTVTVTDFRGTECTVEFTTGLQPGSSDTGTGLGINGFAILNLRQMKRTIDGKVWTADFAPNTFYNLVKLDDLHDNVTTFSYQGEGLFNHELFNRPFQKVRAENSLKLTSEISFNGQTRMADNIKSPRALSDTSSHVNSSNFPVRRVFDERNNTTQVSADFSQHGSDYPAEKQYKYNERGYWEQSLDPDGRLVVRDKTTSINGWTESVITYRGFQSSIDSTPAPTEVYSETVLTKDLNGNVTKEESTYYELDGSQTTTTVDHTYNGLNNRLTSVFPEVADGITRESKSQPRLQWTYTNQGQMETFIDARGVETVYEYDVRENLKSVITENITQRWTYNPAGQITDYYDGNGNHTETTYDIFNRTIRVHKFNQFEDTIIAQRDPEPDSIYTFEYEDNSGSNFFVNDRWNPTLTVDPIGQYNVFTYDDAYRLVKEEHYPGPFQPGFPVGDSDSPKSLEYTLDANGNQTEITIGNAGFGGDQQIEILYDERNREVSRTIIGVNITTNTYYDLAGNVVAEVDGEGFAKYFVRDAQGQVEKSVHTVGVPSPVEFEEANGYRFNPKTISEDDIVFEYAYDGRGNQISQSLMRRVSPDSTDQVNIASHYVYDEMGRMVRSIEDATNAAINQRRVVDYVHDHNSNVRYVLMHRKNNGLDGTAQTDLERDTLVTEYIYDALNRKETCILPEVIDGESAAADRNTNPTIRYQYDNNFNVTRVTDPRDVVTEYVYDGLDRVLSTRINGETDAEDIINFVSYDANGNIVESTSKRTLDFEDTSVVDLTTYFVYDGFNRLVSATDPESYVTQFNYDNLDNVITSTDGRNLTTTFEYDKANRLTVMRRPGVTNTLPDAFNGEPQTTYKYDRRGLLEEAIDPNGQKHRFEYDGAGRRTAYSNPLYNPDLSEVEHRMTYQYDQASNLIVESDFKGNETKYTYDNLNRLRQLEDRAGHAVGYTFDFADNVEAFTDAKGASASYGYDRLNRMVRETKRGNLISPDEEYFAQFEYNLMGAVTRTIDENGNTTESFYDNFNRPIAIVDGESHPTTMAYDQLDNLVAMQDPLGIVMRTKYDRINRPVDVVEAYGTALEKRTQYTYDPNGNRTGILDANGFYTQFEFDQLNRVVRHTLPTQVDYLHGYDAEGNRIITRNPNGEDIVQVFDALDRLELKTFGGDQYSYSYQYDANSNLTLSQASVTNVNGVTGIYQSAYTHHNRDLLHTATVSYPEVDDRMATYLYDQNQNLDSATTYNNRSLDYATNHRDQYSLIKGDFASTGSVQADYSYDPALRLTDKNYSHTVGTVNTPTVNTHYAYDKRNRTLLSHAVADGAEVLRHEYDYDPVGNRRYERMSFNPPGNVNTFTTNADVYRYDELYRVTGAIYDVPETRTSNPIGSDVVSAPLGSPTVFPDPVPAYDTVPKLANQWEEYAFDFLHNRKTATNSERTLTYNSPDAGPYTPDPLNRIVSIDPTNEVPFSLSYDDNGNLLTDSQGNTFHWNAENRLESIEDSGGDTIATYIYDGAGRRVAKHLGNDDVIYYYYEGQEVCLELDPSSGTTGTALAEYLVGPTIDSPIAMIRNDAIYYFHQDILGNIEAITDKTGVVVQRYAYDIHGNFVIQDGYGVATAAPQVSPYLFTGRRYDNESGLYYYRNRYYSADLGRFISTDPLYYVDSMNMYAYAVGNPVNFTDPSGEAIPLLAIMAVGSGISVAVDAAVQYATMEEGDEFSVTSLAISGVMGATGAGVGASITRSVLFSGTKSVAARMSVRVGTTLATGAAEGVVDQGLRNALMEENAGFFDGWKSSAAQGAIFAGVGDAGGELFSRFARSKAGQGAKRFTSDAARAFGRSLREGVGDSLSRTFERGLPLGFGRNAPRMQFAKFLDDPARVGPRVSNGPKQLEFDFVDDLDPAAKQAANGGGSSQKYRILKQKYEAYKKKYKKQKGKDPMGFTDWVRKNRSRPWGIGNIKSGFKKLYRGESYHDHHIFPQELADEFLKRGIDPDQFTIKLPESLHREIHKGEGGGLWNDSWDVFFNDNPKATADDIFEEAMGMTQDFNLIYRNIIPYPKR